MSDHAKSSTPAIILMVPQMGENIGAAARAMANFDLHDLRLVAPRDGWPNAQAEAMAAGALNDRVHVSVFASLGEAIADLHYVLATTARRRDMNKPAYDLQDASTEIANRTFTGKKTGILFGRERNGLENNEVAQCQGLIHIPTNPNFSSINLGQSVLLVAYELFSSVIVTEKLDRSNPETPITKLDCFADTRNDVSISATNADLQNFLSRLEGELEKGGFFRSVELRPQMVQNIMNMFTRAELTTQEVRTLQGMLSALVKQ